VVLKTHHEPLDAECVDATCREFDGQGISVQLAADAGRVWRVGVIQFEITYRGRCAFGKQLNRREFERLGCAKPDQESGSSNADSR
jgi:hypothetical protein